MTIILKNQEKLLVKLKSSFGDDLILKSCYGREAISELFEFKITFLSQNNAIDLEQALGTTLNIAIKSDKQERYIDGIIAEFSQGATENKADIYLTEYTAIIKPKIWLLTLDRNHLIFQKKTAIDIIKKVLQNCGITDIEDKTNFCGKVEREYCVQYAESSFNFISRLMEDEGIFFFFKHTNSKHTLVLADSSNAHEKITEPKIKFLKAVNNIYPLGKIFNTSMTTSVNTGGYAIADYNYTLSQTKLFSKLDSQWKGLPFYEYPGKFSKAKEGEDISKLRVQLFESTHCLFEASSTVANLMPGFLFELTDHHYSKFNKEYTAYSIEHFFEASANSGYIYTNKFKSFHKGTEFRPSRTTPKPRIYGTQTAVVVCSSEEEIFKNEHCSIKVHFHWDQIGKDKDDEESSCWIRVTQMISGNTWGAVFTPRVGQEVVVSFIDGDPDRPLVVGCVYNDKFLPPYTDKEAMISGLKMATFKNQERLPNEFRINDEDQNEEVFFHAAKDVHVVINNERTTIIENSDDTLTINTGSRSITLMAQDPEEEYGGGKDEGKGNHSTKLVKGDWNLEITEGDKIVTLTKGNQTITLSEGDRSVTLTKGKEEITLQEGDRTVTLSNGNLTYDIKGDYTLTVSGDLKIKVDGDINIESGKKTDMKSGAAFEIKSNAAANIESTGTMSLKTGAGSALSAETGAGGALSLKSGAGGTVTAESGAGGNMTIKSGMNLDASAMMNATIKANINFEAKGMVQSALGGAMVNVQGDGMVGIKAPMITIGGGMLSLG